eukprot:snap_masked-scaffold_36-processed-gene-2.36-mRNA-1 protein AED:0.03 eAED:0.03 QI:0/-1/0/1/-1/1/1/0/506
MHEKNLEKPNLFQKVTLYTTYIIIIFLGTVYDFLQFTLKPIFVTAEEKDSENEVQGTNAGKIVSLKDTFYHRRMYTRVADCFTRPICSAAGGQICLTDFETCSKYTYQKMFDELKSFTVGNNQSPRNKGNVLNLGSYNYLGFADDWMNTCGEDVLKFVDKFDLTANSSLTDTGNKDVIKQLEKYIADFLNKEDALVYTMGYGTNASALTCLLTENSLVISDSLNHSSIVNGCRGSKYTKIVPFKHDDVADLERILQERISEGNPALEGKQWSKIIVATEGLFSMEGETCSLPEIVAICKKYKAYLYLDEAHSIGAMGPTGRGVTEYYGVPTSDVAVMMGTFSKSFGGMGGYVAADKETIDYLRVKSFGAREMSALSPVVAQQVLTAFKIINETELGKEKIRRLKSNSNYFRKGLQKLGLIVLGQDDSPVIPVMVWQAAKMAELSRRLLKERVAIVVVGYPAVPLDGLRVRFCISAAHEKEELKRALKAIGKLSKELKLRYQQSYFG